MLKSELIAILAEVPPATKLTVAVTTQLITSQIWAVELQADVETWPACPGAANVKDRVNWLTIGLYRHKTNAVVAARRIESWLKEWREAKAEEGN